MKGAPDVQARQEYALLHPISSAVPGETSTKPYTASHVDQRSGLLLMSVLAVDR